MLTITVREAKEEERIGIDPEVDECLPSNVESFDSSHWSLSLFCNIKPGDWIVEIAVTGENPMRCPIGTFVLQMLEHDGGFCRRLA